MKGINNLKSFEFFIAKKGIKNTILFDDKKIDHFQFLSNQK